jgi:MoaA/NifB/PqqE/SkfB family radical SAM enzyme
VSRSSGRPGLRVFELLRSWKSILGGSTPMLSIEVTRECPLRCPGCYAYGDAHLGGTLNLRSVRDYHGEELINGVIRLVRNHRPMHVSLVGGEPLVRHRELSEILLALSSMKVHTMVVTSAVIPIPRSWMEIPQVRVTVSVDGLPEHHDVRRAPATYERILKNIEGCRVNIHGTLTRPMLQRPGYIEEYISFWDSRPEVVRIWISTYTPQKDEQSAEILTHADREFAVRELLKAKSRHPKLLMNPGIAQAICRPPEDPTQCMFARMSTNYTADLNTQVEPCIFGGAPNCTQCGCAISSGLHWLKNVRLAGCIKIEKIALTSMAIGSLAARLRRVKHRRWSNRSTAELVQINMPERPERKVS